jgi:hypothetical protein
MATSITTVWMVHALTDERGEKGRLSIEGDALVFHPQSGSGEHSFRFDQVKKVRRTWGSPVIELRLDIPQGLPAVAFYFLEPPSLEPPPDTRFSFRRRRRRDAIVQLTRANSSRGKEVEQWVELIRSRVGR